MGWRRGGRTVLNPRALPPLPASRPRPCVEWSDHERLNGSIRMWRREWFPWQRQEAREERPGAEGEGREGEGSALEAWGGGCHRPEGQEWGQQRDGELGLGFGTEAQGSS